MVVLITIIKIICRYNFLSLQGWWVIFLLQLLFCSVSREFHVKFTHFLICFILFCLACFRESLRYSFIMWTYCIAFAESSTSSGTTAVQPSFLPSFHSSIRPAIDKPPPAHTYVMDGTYLVRDFSRLTDWAD